VYILDMAFCNPLANAAKYRKALPSGLVLANVAEIPNRRDPRRKVGPYP
jgi:hypothetical protein